MDEKLKKRPRKPAPVDMIILLKVNGEENVYLLLHQDGLEIHAAITAYSEWCCTKKKEYMAWMKNIFEIYVTADSNSQKTLLLTNVEL